jgi:hypothetical protein
VMPSSETETCSRGRSALDRDGALLEGVSSPRARRNLTRGGVRPSSEAEPYPRGDRPSSEANLFRCGVVPLERSAAPPEGGLGRLSGGSWVRGFVLHVFFTNLSGFSLVV